MWLREQAERLGLGRVWVRSSTDQLHNLAVQGPKSREVLKSLVWTSPTRPSLEELGWFRFTVGRLGDSRGPAILVSRTGYTGELGYEVWCHPRGGPRRLGRDLGGGGSPVDAMTPLGLEEHSTSSGSRPGLIFAGSTSSTTRSTRSRPGSASYSPRAKSEDFIGKEALLRPQAVLRSGSSSGSQLEGNETGDARATAWTSTAPVGWAKSPAAPLAPCSART